MFNNKILLKSQQVFRGNHHNVYTVEINKTVLSSNDDKALQTLDRVTTYPHGTNAFKLHESEMMMVRGFFVKKHADCPFYCKVISIQYKRIQSMRKRDVK